MTTLLFILLLQTDTPSHARPWLPPGADSNDYQTYLSLASAYLDRDPRGNLALAETAFVWASRLAPNEPAPYYRRALAIVRPVMAAVFLQELDSVRFPHRLTVEQQQLVDSLLNEAWMRNPFLDPPLDTALAFAFGHPDPRRIKNPEMKGLAAFLAGDFTLAVASWDEALRRKPKRLDLRYHRAVAFYQLQRYDSAAAELDRLVAEIGTAESSRIVLLGPRTDMLYYAIGDARERNGDLAAAREAYTRALSENLGLNQVHARLAHLLWTQHDTTGQLTELSIASGVAPGNAWLRMYYGLALLQAGKPAAAVEQLQAAIAADPEYAMPHYLLGRADEYLSQYHDAITQYEAFLAHAAATDALRAETQTSVAQLRVALADSSHAH